MLTDRGAAVLDAIVERFILTGEPVGSTSIHRLLPERVSPATVRNVMAELERLGYLEQPHTSAGRAPTRRGYRRYVENLTAEGRYDAVDPGPLAKVLQDETAEVGELLRRTCKLLAELSELVGVSRHHRWRTRCSSTSISFASKVASCWPSWWPAAAR